MIAIPSADELAQSSVDFDREWGGVDEVLYELCRRHPGHADLRATTAELALIGRAYSAGLERRVSPKPGEQAISIIARYVHRHDHRGHADDIIAALTRLSEPLTVGSVEQVVELHGSFTRLLIGVTTDKKAPRSFVAKYLHFHNPIVPIYDSNAAAGVTKHVRWDPKAVPFSRPEAGDVDYYRFCVRFWRLYDACRKHGLDVTVKSLDAFLWAVPEKSRRRQSQPVSLQ